MKKFILFLGAALLSAMVFSQTLLFHENFEPPSNGDSVTSYGAPVGWAINSRIAAQGIQCDSNYVQLNDTSYLQTLVFNCTGNSNVMLYFSHICKIELLDAGEIEVSVNGGPWTKLTGAHYIQTDPMSQFLSQGNKFSSNAYPITWQSTVNSARPEQSWWKHETFDISTLAGNAASVQIRFVLRDGNGNGANNAAGWFIDNIRVVGAISELVPPVITMKPPVIQDTITSTGPFDIYAWITDASGIDTAFIIYKVNNGPDEFVPMVWVSDSTYMGTIPSYTYTNRIDYKIRATDASAMQNTGDGASHWFYINKPPSSIVVGTGTLTSSIMPVYGLYEHGWGAMLYRSNELNFNGIIDSIAFYVNSVTANYTMAKQKIFIGHVAPDTWGTAQPDTSAMTVVYEGPMTYTGPGWHRIKLQNTFYYNGSANLMIYWVNKAGTWVTGYPVFRYTSTTPNYRAAYKYAINYSDVFPVSSGTVTYNRPNLRIAYQAQQMTQDAGITQITDPSGTVISNVSIPVNVIIKNFASDTLNNVTVGWTLDGVPQSDYHWTGSLPEAVSSLPVHIGNINVGVGPHEIMAWTENPNDSTDQNVANDTAFVAFYACTSPLAGTYTVGGPGADYETFADVLTALNNCGINAPVVFLVNDGIYNEQLTFEHIFGVSSINTITFKPAAGAIVEIISNSATSTIRFNGTDYIIFDGSNNGTNTRDMSITNTNTSAATAAIWISSGGTGNGCRGITFTNCKISAGNNSVVTYGICAGGATIGSTGDDNDGLSVINNEFTSAYNAIWVRAGATGKNDNLRIVGNVIGSNDPADYVVFRGVDVIGANAPFISGNKIFNMRTAASLNVAGIDIGTNVTDARIEKNEIFGLRSTSTSGYGAYGINISSGTGVAEIMIVNNFIYDIVTAKYSTTSTTWNPFGIRITGGANTKVYHNSINLFGEPTTGSSASMSAALVITATGVSGVDIRNNIFANSMTGNAGSKSFCIFVPSGYSFASGMIDYNDYYPSGPFGLCGYSGVDRATLANWRTFSLQDSNSVSLDPEFFTPTNLHTFSINVSNAGTPIAVVNDDFDGDARNPLTPDIGADEFDLPAYEVRIMSVISPGSSCVQGAAEDVTIKIRNTGQNPVSNISAWYAINNGMPVHEVIPGTIAPLDSLTYTFSAKANLIAFGTYSFDMYINHPLDANLLNDTIKNYVVYSGYNFSIGDYTMSFENTEFFDDWSVLSVNGDNFTWQAPFVGFPRTGTNSARFFNGSTNSGGDWLFSRCFPLVAGETYEISYWYRGGSTTTASRLNLKYGLSPTPAGMTILLDSMPNILSTTYQNSTSLFVAPATGVFYFGWYAYTNPGTIHMYIDDINIKYYPPQEAALVNLSSPVSGCGLSNAEQVSIDIVNTGSGNINGNITAYYSVNGGPPVSQAVPNTILPGDTLVFTFTATVDMSVTTQDSVFNILSWIVLPNDPFQFNDTILAEVESWHIPYDPIVLNDTVVQNYPATLYAFSADTVLWYDAPLASAHFHIGNVFVTPPLTDTTTFYVEAATSQSFSENVGMLNGGTSSFITQTVGWGLHFNVTQETVLDYVHVYPTGTGTITIHILDVTNNILQSSAPFALSGNGSQKIQVPVNLTILPGSYKIGMSSTGITNLVRESSGVTFPYVSPSGAVTIVSGATGTGTTTSSYYWFYDWGVKSPGAGCTSNRVPVTAFVVYPAEDIAMIDILAPVDGCTDGFEDVTVQFFNNGIDTIQNPFTLGYQVAGNPVPTIETVNYVVLPGDTLTHTFATPASMPVTGNDTIYQITVFGNNNGDVFFLNDTAVAFVELFRTPMNPVVTDDTILFGNTATLFAYNTDPVYWYVDDSIAAHFFQGLVYNTPVLFDTVTYYVSSKLGSSPAYVGAYDNTIGTTSSYATDFYYLIFDVLEPGGTTIESVDVFPSTAAGTAYSIQLLNSSGLLLQEYFGTTTVASGQRETAPVNFSVPFGTQYRIKFGVTSGFFRNTTGANFPYTLPGLISITGHNFSGYPQYYYFFYNWKVGSGSGCESDRIPVTAYVIIPAEDIAIIEIPEPVDGCTFGTEDITVKVKNFGYDTIQNPFTLGYYISGNPVPTTEVVNYQIPPGDTITHTFAVPAVMTVLGGDSTFTITVFGDNPGDVYFLNDSLSKTVTLTFSPPDPIVTHDTIPYATQATLQALSPWLLSWFDQPAGGMPIDTGSSFVTPVLFANETYYVEASSNIPGGVTVIGSGTATQSLMPTNGFWDYSWSAQLYTPAELGFTGRIDTIAVFVGNTPASFLMLDQRIYMRTVPYDVYADADYINPAGATLVFSDDITWNGTGWHRIALQTPFDYDGSGSLEILWENWDGDWVSGYPTFRYTSTTNVYRAKYKNQDNSFPAIVGTQSYNRTNIYFAHTIPGCPSNRVPVHAVVTGQPNLDCGVIAITEPVTPTSLGVKNVKAVIRNFGLDTLTTVTVNWTVNGVPQAPFAWAGVLPTGSIDSVVIGTYDFLYYPYPGILHEIVAWTSQPNGGVDFTTINDTSSVVIDAYDPYNGIYYIQTPTPDFPNFATAVLGLSDWGVSGPVTILAESGTYTEQISISPIPGASDVNTVTFASQTGINTDVILQFAATGTANNYVVRLNGADHIGFTDMTIRSSTLGTWGRVVEFTGGADYNRFENNIIQSITGTSSSAAGIYSTGSSNHYNRFVGNKILNGYYGVYFYGPSANRNQGNHFIDNDITGWYYYGLYVYYADSVRIEGNTITNGPTSATNYHIYAGYCHNGSRIEKNKIHGTGSGTFYGIYAYYNNNTPTIPNTIANNFVSQIGGSGTAYGLYLYYSNYLNVYFNSVSISGGTATGGRALFLTGGTSNVNIVNNNLGNFGGGYAYYAATPAAIAVSNYNNLYTSGSVLAYWTADRANLAALRAASGKDMNSISVIPGYYSVSDLHTTAIDLYLAGIPAGGITTDIDGDLRNPVTPCIGADEFIPPPVDAGVLSIDAPTSPVGGGAQNIIVTLKNYGLDTLTSATIKFDVGGTQGAPFTWTGSLASGQSLSNVNIGSFTFVSGVSHIKAWTEMPNGTTDPVAINDTAYKTVIVCAAPLAGTYTLGGTGADFYDFTEAVLTLQYCGISAPVIFNVNSGNYTEQLSIPEIIGATAINTITFQSATGVNTDVTLMYGATSAADNFVVQLNGADFFIFKNMTIQSTTMSTFGRVVVLLADANSNRFENNIIRSIAGTSSNAAGVYSTSGSAESFNVFTRNRIENGYYGIYFYGTSALMKEYNEFTDNEIAGYHYYGIYNYYGLATVVSGNTLTNGSSSGINYHIYMYYSDDGVRVEKNKIHGTGSSSFYGIYMYYCDGLPGNPNVVANNFVTQSVGTGTAYGIYVLGSTYTNLYYNSVNITGGSATGGRAIFHSGGSNIRIVNNIMVNTGGGYAYYVATPTAVLQSDHNDIYTTGGSYAYWTSAVANLAALQANSGKDLNSVSADPGFISATDLHVTGVAVNGLATPIAGITTDIDGDLRNPLTPDIGADEYTPLPYDVAVTAFLLPAKSYAAVGAQDTVRIEIRNLGVNTVNSFGIHYKYAGLPAVNATWTGTLAPNQTTVYTFTTYFNAIAGTHSLCAYTTLTGDGNLSNDTLCRNYTGVPVLVVPYSTDFESNNYFYAAGDYETWEYGVPSASTINSAYSPTHCWATNLDGYYMNSSNEFLYSPYFNFTQAQNGVLEFWHWYQTEQNYDGGNIQYSLNGGVTWITLGYIGDPAGTNWYNQSIGGAPYFAGNSSGWVYASYNLATVPAIVNSVNPVQFRFRFISDATGNTYDGWAVDNFAIKVPLIAKDAGVAAIVNPAATTVTGSSVSVQVTLQNFGSDTLQSIPVAYSINNGPQTQQTWTGLLQPGATTNFSFTAPYTSPGVPYTLCAFTKKAGDTYKFNDTTCVAVNALPAPDDAGVTAILTPGTTTIANDSIEVQIRIRNFGTSTLTSVPVGYKRNGVQIATAVWTGALAGGDSVTFTFAQKYVSPLSNYSLCAYSMLPNDANALNDEVCIYPEGVIGIGEYAGDGFYLWQNIPNPATEGAIIAFQIPAGGKVLFEVRDLTGRIIYTEQEQRDAGLHRVELDVSSLATGVYYYYAEFDGKRLTKKMVISK
jgi:hypothetical protein